jgi:hypothetical protein
MTGTRPLDIMYRRIRPRNLNKLQQSECTASTWKPACGTQRLRAFLIFLPNVRFPHYTGRNFFLVPVFHITEFIVNCILFACCIIVARK